MKPYRKATIKPTSVANFYSVLSSNGYDCYPLIVTGPQQITCGCPAGEAHRNCYHRQFALVELVYIPVEDETIDEVAAQRIKRMEREYRAREVARFQSSDLPPAA